MMFLRKSSAVLFVRLLSIAFLCIMFAIFIRISLISEDTKSEYINEGIKSEEQSNEGKLCYSEYTISCFFALVLGAYINVKKLLKLGIL